MKRAAESVNRSRGEIAVIEALAAKNDGLTQICEASKIHENLTELRPKSA